MSDCRTRFQKLMTRVRGMVRVPRRRKSNLSISHPGTDQPSDNLVKHSGTGQRLELHDLPDPFTVDNNVTSVPKADEATDSPPVDWPLGPLPESGLVPDILVNYEHTESLPEPSVQSGPSSLPEQSGIIQASGPPLNDHGTDRTRENNSLPDEMFFDNIAHIHNDTVSDDDPDRLSFVTDIPDIMSVAGASETYVAYNEEPTDLHTHEPLLGSDGRSYTPSVEETIDPFSRGEICQGPLPERAMPNEYLHEYFSVYDAIKARTLEIHGTYETFQHGPRIPIGYSRLLDEHFLPRAEDNDRGSPLCIGPTEIALELLETRYDQSVPSPYDWNKPAIGGHEAGFKYTKQELIGPMEVAFRHLGSSFQVAEKVGPQKDSKTGYTPCKAPRKGRSARPDDFGHSSRIEDSLQRDPNSADFVFYYRKPEQSGPDGVHPYVIVETKSPGFINNAKWRDWENHPGILELLDRARRQVVYPYSTQHRTHN
ncbi:hypothetical protein BDV97DRAFT_388348 [Delphinella strobiligena]|nr:hypothetical protein BDV97DRAFT_388348 [Delphinella strobiligena]